MVRTNLNQTKIGLNGGEPGGKKRVKLVNGSVGS